MAAIRSATGAGRRSERRLRGFEQAATLLRARIRDVGEARGFAVAEVLTRWDAIAGPALAAVTRPVKVSYAGRGFGATLVILVSGAHAPLVEMQKERLRQQVNACYGCNAVARIQITQTASAGFAEAQAEFRGAVAGPAGGTSPPAAPDPEAARLARQVRDPELRAVLEEMGRAVSARRRARE